MFPKMPQAKRVKFNEDVEVIDNFRVARSCWSMSWSGKNGAKQLKLWGLFRGVEVKTPILKNLKSYYIFGKTGIIATRSDDVYLFKQLDGFTKVDELCGKEITEFVSGVETNCYALTDYGSVYSWGSNNTTHQLGLGFGFKNGSTEPKRVKGTLEGKMITQLVASESHALALTDDGEVHGWGNNQNGQLGKAPWGPEVFYISPHLLQIKNATGDIIVSVAVMQNYSFLLTKAGDVIRWGAMEQEGDGSTKDRPRKVRFKNPKFKKIISSRNRIFALSVDGDLYKIDKDRAFPMFPRDKILSHRVVDISGDPKIELCVFKTEGGRIYVWGDKGGGIIQDHYIATTCTKLDEAFAIFWGQTCRTMKVKNLVDEQPPEVDFVAAKGGDPVKNLVNEQPPEVEIVAAKGGDPLKNLVDEQPPEVEIVAAKGGDPVKNLVNEQPPEVEIVAAKGGDPVKNLVDEQPPEVEIVAAKGGDPLKNLVDEQPPEVEIVPAKSIDSDIDWNVAENPVQCDVEFSVDGKRIRAHKLILIDRSEHFKRYFANLKNTEYGRPIHVLSTWDAFCGRLHYIYSNKLLYSAQEHDKLCDLMQSAEEFGEKELRNKCEEALIQGLTKENVFFIFRHASSLKALDLANASSKFIIQNRQILDIAAELKNLRKEAVVKLVEGFFGK